MHRILLGQEIEVGKESFVEGPPMEALRFQGARVGSIVTLTDGRGKDFRGRVCSLSDEGASVLVFDVFPSSTESRLEVVLLQALPERERMELIIQKATELGVSAIVPFKAERSISLQEREAKQKKAHRWQEIALQAVRQSRRARVPIVEAYRGFDEVLEFCKGEGLKVLLWEKEGGSLKKILREYFKQSAAVLRASFPPIENLPSSPPFGKGGVGGFEVHPSPKIYAMVGPEGGFTEEEARLAREKGFVSVKLGQRILRTETAAITLVGILQYELGDLG